MNNPSFINIPKWFNERFPVPVIIQSMILYFVSGSFISTVYNVPFSFSLSTVIASLVAVSFFLMVRVIDEHKDYGDDNNYHQERVLQRGLISLTHLKVIGVLCVFFQIGFCLWRDGWVLANVTMAWIYVMIWFVLMSKEFFVAEWLKARIVLYGVSHMAIMFFVAYWFCQMALPSQIVGYEYLPVGFAIFLSGLVFEIIRKTRGLDEERDGVDSYSKAFGTQGAIWVSLALLFLLMLTMGYLFLIVVGAIVSIYSILMLVFLLLPLYFFRSFFANPTKKGRSKNELSVGMFMLLTFILFLVA